MFAGQDDTRLTRGVVILVRIVEQAELALGIEDAAHRLIEQRDGSSLTLQWQTDGDTAFPMPLDIKVGDRVMVAAMEGGSATVDLGSADAHYVIDPMAKVLRHNPHIERWQAWVAEQEALEKAKAEAAAKAEAEAETVGGD